MHQYSAGVGREDPSTVTTSPGTLEKTPIKNSVRKMRRRLLGWSHTTVRFTGPPSDQIIGTYRTPPTCCWKAFSPREDPFPHQSSAGVVTGSHAEERGTGGGALGDGCAEMGELTGVTAMFEGVQIALARASAGALSSVCHG